MGETASPNPPRDLVNQPSTSPDSPDVTEYAESNPPGPPEATDPLDQLAGDISAGIKDRDGKYTEFLNSFVNDFTKRISQKSTDRRRFFHGMVWCSIGLGVVFAAAILFSVFKDQSVGTLVTLIAGVITEFISIPLIIAKYLFNPEEDANIHNLISAMQGHDAAGRELLFKQKAKLGENALNVNL